MNISDFYHNEYIWREEIFLDSERLKYERTGKPISEEVEQGHFRHTPCLIFTLKMKNEK